MSSLQLLLGMMSTAGLLEFLLLRRFHGKWSVIRTVLIAGITSAIVWWGMHFWIIEAQWGWKAENQWSPLSIEIVLIAIFIGVMIALWSLPSFISAGAVAWACLKFSSASSQAPEPIKRRT